MRSKNIKSIIKTLMITTIISFSMINIVFADDNKVKTIQDFCNEYMVLNNGNTTNINHYVSKVTVDDNGTTIVKYLDGSWYSFNTSKFDYKFKPIEVNEPLCFADEYVMYQCIYDYDAIKNNNLMLNDRNSCLRGFGKHSDIIYAENLQTNENLTKYATQWLKDNYNLTLDVPVTFDDVLGDVGGCTTLTNDDIPINIKINKQVKGIDILSEKILIHELTHYALNKLNKEYNDGTESFTNECVKNGSNTSDDHVGFLHSHLQCTL